MPGGLTVWPSVVSIAESNSASTFTYVVTDTGNVPLSGVVVRDDNGTPANPADDFNPTFSGGDTNTNGLLDPTETWTYTATATALAGQQTNVGTVTGQDVNTLTTVTDDNPANYFGDAAGIGFAALTFELAAFAPVAGDWISDDRFKRELADVNGDGMDDIVGFGAAGVYVSLATGDGHFAEDTFELAAFAPDAGGWISDDLFKRELADVNGDGSDDIVGFGAAGVYVSLSQDFL